MNKYITVLLVVLAATGVEAQDCQSALKIALGDVGIEDLSRQQAFTGVGQEILSVLEAFKQMEDDEAQSKAVYTADRTDRFPAASTSYSDTHQEQQLFLPNPSLTTGIQIRAPSPAA